MASIHETGHAKNVANFYTLISFVTAYGAIYNPSRVAIQLAELQATANAADAVMQQVNTLLASNGNAIAARELAFEPIKKLSTRLLNALKATDAANQVIDNMASLNRKMQGTRASKKVEPLPRPGVVAENRPGDGPASPPKQISSAQLSFDSLLDTFDKQVKLLASIAVYAPNENELSITSLQAVYSTLQNANAAVVDTATQLSNARLARNQTMYHPETGLVATALNVKNYVKSIFGASDANYKQISAIAFTNYKP